MAKKAYVYDGTQWVEITSQPTVATATTGNLGIVQLTDSVSSTSTTTAAVPNSVKTAYDFTSTVQARTLTGTAPITIDGVNTAKDLSANRTIAVNSASTSASGVVQLSDSTNTTSSVLAATPTAVKSAYDLAAAAVPKSTVTAKGDLISATAASTIANLGVGADYTVLTALSSTSTGLSWASRNPDIQEFTANGTWTKPAGRTVTFVMVIGGGGGGQGGTNATGTAYAGSGGVVITRMMKTSDLGSTETVTIGGGGAGGAHPAGAGISGTATTFGSKFSARGGGGGSNSVGNATVGRAYIATDTSGGQKTDGQGGTTAATATIDSIYGTAGGGVGANATSGAGSAGGGGFNGSSGSGGAGGAAGGSTGGAGTTATTFGSGGGGGGGGTTTGGAGGAGYLGGGGGGGGRGGTTGGAGGAGGSGYVLVISW